jgi:hypothetical protein
MPTDTLTGGCVCGAIRFEIGSVFDAGYCHCDFCRKSSGAPVSAVAWVAGDEFRVTKGEPRMRSRSDGNYCSCDECGSGGYLEIRAPGHLLARDGRYYSIPLGTLDDPERVSPRIHQFIEKKVSWLKISDDLPRVTGNTSPHPDKR